MDHERTAPSDRGVDVALADLDASLAFSCASVIALVGSLLDADLPAPR